LRSGKVQVGAKRSNFSAAPAVIQFNETSPFYNNPAITRQPDLKPQTTAGTWKGRFHWIEDVLFFTAEEKSNAIKAHTAIANQ
jgi:hypothetical protein